MARDAALGAPLHLLIVFKDLLPVDLASRRSMAEIATLVTILLLIFEGNDVFLIAERVVLRPTVMASIDRPCKIKRLGVLLDLCRKIVGYVPQVSSELTCCSLVRFVQGVVVNRLSPRRWTYSAKSAYNVCTLCTLDDFPTQLFDKVASQNVSLAEGR